jgi:sulfide:quinone oxidoreductase
VLLLHDQFVTRGYREHPETSAALVEAFAERAIRLVTSRKVAALDLTGRNVVLDDGTELPYDLFLGVPRQQAPAVVLESGLAENGYVPVDPATLETRFPGVYAIGDVATQGTPKAAVFAEGAGRVDIDFLTGPAPTGTYNAPSVALRGDKERFGSSRRARWFSRAG